MWNTAYTVRPDRYTAALSFPFFYSLLKGWLTTRSRERDTFTSESDMKIKYSSFFFF